MHEVFIIEGVRSPIGKVKGAFSQVHPNDLASYVMQSLFEKTQIPAEDAELVVFGCMNMIGEQSLNIGRNAWLSGGLPIHVPAVSMDYQGGSGLQAINTAAGLIQTGQYHLIVAGGVENLSRVPFGSGPSHYGNPISDSWVSQHQSVHPGYSAELVAEKYGYTRRDLDHFAYQSHLKAARARKEGRFAKEIVPYQLSDGRYIEHDECIRENVQFEKMTTLSTPFKEDGVVTAANCSALGDGSAALLLASKAYIEKHNIQPRAKIVSQGVAGVDPTLMLMGTVPSTTKALHARGLSIQDIDVFEINESFASALLGWMEELDVEEKKVNPNGGSIALGDPVGATGVRLILSLLNQMEHRDLEIGAATINCGGGMGVTTIIDCNVSL
ncbi:thiolase family protein [Peribacillus cavernae]|uniref:thiolase family protein n=1 Tax=Peribacillus cavernae TaxID=1674310 RepID=UPI00163C220E|nr:thiolase family protein [Peribacillus cavernae]MDQ0218098.1 acetyl-CoA acetyltransferase family protein [Peribacillus cavernae]